MSKYRKCLWKLLTICAGILLSAAGWYLTFNWIDIFTNMRGQKMALSPDSPVFTSWKTPPIPLHFDVYIFNWTNPQDFYVGSNKKPHFVQLGPYRFLEKSDKVNITWSPNNYTLTYRNYATFHFDALGSNGSLTDDITCFNTVAYETARRSSNASFFQKYIIQNVLNFHNLSITKTAEEWIFKGYEDSIINMGRIASIFMRDIDTIYDRIGYMYTRNDSSKFDGVMNVYSGADDIRKIGQIANWNYNNKTAYPDKCGQVHGSMGQFFKPNLKTTDILYIYIPNLCRAIPLEYQETVYIHGIMAFKFAGSLRSIDNGTLYPENKCFCNNGNCEAIGTMYIGYCKYNASVYMSYPHFYLADKSYLAGIEGLNPDPIKHEFYLSIDPISGIPMDAGGGFQGNYLVEPLPFTQYKNITRTFIPLMWAEERVRVTYDMAHDIAIMSKIITAGHISAGILLAFGVILIFWYPFKTFKKLWQDPKAKSKIIINAPELVSDAVSSSVAHIRRPLQQISLLEFKQPTCGEIQYTNESNDMSTQPLVRRTNTNISS